jgi:hypothetical protein
MQSQMAENQPRDTGFRREHPVFFWGMLALIAVFLTGTAVMGSRIPGFKQQESQILAQMSEAERATRDELLQHSERRTQLSLALLQRDVRVRALEERGLHLALSIEDSTLSLRHGPATLRSSRVTVGGDSVVTAPDGRTWRFVQPVGERRIREKSHSPAYTIPEWVYVSRGEAVPEESARRVKGGLGAYVLRLDDGTEIYSRPTTGPLAEGVKPGAFVAPQSTLAAIFEAVRVDTPVFIY